MTDDPTLAVMRDALNEELGDLPIFLVGHLDGGFVFGLSWDKKDATPGQEYVDRLQELVRCRVVTSENPILRKMKKETLGLVIDPAVTRPRHA